MPTEPVLRAATFNLLHGLSLRTGTAHEADLAEAGRGLDADVVGLQEVDAWQPRSGGVHQTAVIAEALSAGHWRFAPAVLGTPSLQPGGWTAVTGNELHGPARDACAGQPRDAPAYGSPPGRAIHPAYGPAYGIGLVSRWPVREWAVLRFPPAPLGLPLLIPARPRPRLRRVPDEPRVALLAVLDGPSGPVTAVTAHLSFVPGVNVRQLRAVARWARRFPAPRLLIGDFNLPGRAPVVATGWRQLARAATYPSYRPRVQFDHALGDGLGTDAVRGVQSLQLPVSDHCALTVDVDLSATG